MDALAKELDLPASQLLGLFNAMIRKITAKLRSTYENAIKANMEKNVSKLTTASNKQKNLAPLEDELQDAAEELKRKQKAELSKLKDLDFSQYAIRGTDEQWSSALDGSKAKSLISVKTGEKRLADEKKVGDDLENGGHSKKKAKKHKDGSNKKGNKSKKIK